MKTQHIGRSQALSGVSPGSLFAIYRNQEVVIALKCRRLEEPRAPGFFLLTGSQKHSFMPENGSGSEIVHVIPDAVLQPGSYELDYSPLQYNPGDLLSLSGKLAILEANLGGGVVKALDLDSHSFGQIVPQPQPLRFQSWKIIHPGPAIGIEPITLVKHPLGNVW